jgi:hypothetical protein
VRDAPSARAASLVVSVALLILPWPPLAGELGPDVIPYVSLYVILSVTYSGALVLERICPVQSPEGSGAARPVVRFARSMQQPYRRGVRSAGVAFGAISA